MKIHTFLSAYMMELSGKPYFLAIFLIAFLSIHFTDARYSASEDAAIIAAFRQRALPPRNHAKVVRKLVHDVNWASIGSISTDKKLNGFPMVNVISISDSVEGGRSTGKIFFLLTDLDFTGKDWRKENKVTLLFSKEQGGKCSGNEVDPMEPVCPRAIISGKIIEIKQDDDQFAFGWHAFISRHPAATSWIKKHHFYLCLLDIEHIYGLDWYGGARDIKVEDYYKANPEDDSFEES